MLLYTSIIVVSFLVAIPILILVYETISLTNKVASDCSGDELVATTGRIPDSRYHVKRAKLNYTESTTRHSPAAIRSFREEKLTSFDRSSKVGVKEVQGAVTLESVCKPFKRKSSVTLDSKAVKKPLTPEAAAKTPNPGTICRPVTPGFAPSALNVASMISN